MGVAFIATPLEHRRRQPSQHTTRDQYRKMDDVTSVPFSFFTPPWRVSKAKPPSWFHTYYLHCVYYTYAYLDSAYLYIERIALYSCYRLYMYVYYRWALDKRVEKVRAKLPCLDLPINNSMLAFTRSLNDVCIYLSSRDERVWKHAREGDAESDAGCVRSFFCFF